MQPEDSKDRSSIGPRSSVWSTTPTVLSYFAHDNTGLRVFGWSEVKSYSGTGIQKSVIGLWIFYLHQSVKGTFQTANKM